MRNVIFTAFVFVIVLAAAFLAAIYDFDINKTAYLLIGGIIVFYFLFDKLYPKKNDTIVVNGKMTPEEINEVVKKQQDEECPTLLRPLWKGKLSFQRWGQKHKLNHMGKIYWGLVIMLITAVLFIALALFSPQISEDTLGPIGGFIMICFCAGLMQLIRGIIYCIMDYFF